MSPWLLRIEEVGVVIKKVIVVNAGHMIHFLNQKGLPFSREAFLKFLFIFCYLQTTSLFLVPEIIKAKKTKSRLRYHVYLLLL